MDLHFRCCSCYFARLEIKNPDLIKSMFPHVLHYHGCGYVCSLEAISTEPLLGEFEKENKNGFVLFFGHCRLGLCPGWPPPRAVSVFSGKLWFFQSTLNAVGSWAPDGPRGVTVLNLDRVGTVKENLEKNRNHGNIPAVVACLCPEECLLLMKDFVSHACDPWAPQGLLGTFGVRRSYANFPRAPQVSFGPFETPETFATSTSDPRASQVSLWPPEISSILQTFACCPGAPQGSFGIPGARRNSANSLRVPQATLGTQVNFGIQVSDPRAPRGPLKTASLWNWRHHWLARGAGHAEIIREDEKLSCLNVENTTLEIIMILYYFIGLETPMIVQ